MFKSTLYQTIRYAFAGLLNTTMAFVIYMVCIKLLGIVYWAANFIAISIGVVTGFILSKLFVFKGNTQSMQSASWRYLVVFGGQYAIGTFVIAFGISRGASDAQGYIIAIPFMVAAGYLGQKYFVFKSGAEQKPRIPS